MNKFSALLMVMFVSSCSGMKVMKEPPATQESKPGLSFGGSPVSGGITVQKVGFWCEAKEGILTFGQFGETEVKAKANAQEKCRGTFKSGKCEIASCKPA